MTTEHRLRFDPTDLAAVAVECTACGSSVTVPFEAINPPDPQLGVPGVPEACPRCGAGWESRGNRSAEATFLADLALFLRRQADDHRARPVRIRLELDAELRTADPGRGRPSP